MPTPFVALAMSRRLYLSLQENIMCPWPRLGTLTTGIWVQTLPDDHRAVAQTCLLCLTARTKQASDRISNGFLSVTGTAQLPT